MLAARARGLAEDGDEPILDLLVTAVDAAAAAVTGDIDRALTLLARPVPGLAAAEVPGAVTRLHWHFLLLAGRASDAADLVAGRDPVRGMDTPRELCGWPAGWTATPRG
jgi:hypothetical protein